MRIAIIGRTQILYETTKKLYEEGHQISCIITSKAEPEYSRTDKDFEQLAKKINIPFVLTSTLNKAEIEILFKDLDAGVSVNWVSIIPQRHIDLFRLGILNAHLGDLPKYRGNAAANWAIINNEMKITNTIHFMEGGLLDCGRVIVQNHFDLTNDATISDVYKWAEETTPALFVRALKEIDNNHNYFLKYAKADSDESFRCYPRLPEDSFIDWNLSAINIHNLIRAVCYPFSGAYTYHWHKGEIKKLTILKSRVINNEAHDFAVPGHVLENNNKTGESYVRCGSGIIALLECKYDEEHEVFTPGKRWKSIRMRLGVRMDDWLWYIYKNKA